MAMVRPEMVGTVMAVAVLFLCTGVEAQHSKPIPDNSHIERNKFKQRDVTGNSQFCPSACEGSAATQSTHHVLV